MPTDTLIHELEHSKNAPKHAGGLFANIFPVLTAIATCVFVVFCALLWKVNKETYQSSIAAQRAFITTTGLDARVGRIADNDGKKVIGYTFGTAWVNSGSTASKTATMLNSVAVWPAAPQGGFDFDSLPDIGKRSFVFSPKQGTPAPPAFVSLENMEAAAQGKAHVFFWGWVVYHDVFPGTPTRLAEYCIELTNVKWTKVDHSDLGAELTMATPACQTHNCLDGECPDYKKRTE
jgi:hypothetical protein